MAMLVVTTNDLPGYRIVKHFGVVRGITVRSRSAVSYTHLTLPTNREV